MCNCNVVMKTYLCYSEVTCDLYSPPGGDAGGLQFLSRVFDWPSVPGPHSRLPRSRPRPLRAHLHTVAVLLLCWVAEGQKEVKFLHLRTEYGSDC